MEEKSLALYSLDKELFELLFFQENQITTTNYCCLQGKNNSWITHAGQRSLVPHFLHKKKVCTEFVLSREMKAVRKGYLLDELKHSIKNVDISIHEFTNTYIPVLTWKDFWYF